MMRSGIMLWGMLRDFLTRRTRRARSGLCSGGSSGVCSGEIEQEGMKGSSWEGVRCGRWGGMVLGRGLEPPRGCPHQPLKLACLPFHHPSTSGCSAKNGRHNSAGVAVVQAFLRTSPSRKMEPVTTTGRDSDSAHFFAAFRAC